MARNLALYNCMILFNFVYGIKGIKIYKQEISIKVKTLFSDKCTNPFLLSFILFIYRLKNGEGVMHVFYKTWNYVKWVIFILFCKYLIKKWVFKAKELIFLPLLISGCKIEKILFSFHTNDINISSTFL